MRFSKHKAIYLQIIDFVCEQILSGGVNTGIKINSVREMAGHLGVNPNTVMRAYDKLQDLEILENKRGIGLFVSDLGSQNARKYLKDNFIEEEIPSLFRSMELLGITPQDLQTKFEDYKVAQTKQI